MYATTLQFDVLFRLKELTKDYNLKFEDCYKIDSEILDVFFNDMIKFSIIGVYCYQPFKKLGQHNYNPIRFTWDWFNDIFDSKSIEITKMFQDTLCKYYKIDSFDYYDIPLYKGKNLFKIKTLEEFDSIAKFDYKSICEKSIITKDTEFDKCNYYLLNGNVIDKTFSYKELIKYLKEKEYAFTMVDKGYLMSNTFKKEIIVAEGYFTFLKSIKDYLVEIDFSNIKPWQLQQLVYRFGEKQLIDYVEPYLDKCYCDVYSAKFICMSNKWKQDKLITWINSFVTSTISRDFALIVSEIKSCKDESWKKLCKSILIDLLDKNI